MQIQFHLRKLSRSPAHEASLRTSCHFPTVTWASHCPIPYTPGLGTAAGSPRLVPPLARPKLHPVSPKFTTTHASFDLPPNPKTGGHHTWAQTHVHMDTQTCRHTQAHGHADTHPDSGRGCFLPARSTQAPNCPLCRTPLPFSGPGTNCRVTAPLS